VFGEWWGVCWGCWGVGWLVGGVVVVGVVGGGVVLGWVGGVGGGVGVLGGLARCSSSVMLEVMASVRPMVPVVGLAQPDLREPTG